jgi:hypothetical protein
MALKASLVTLEYAMLQLPIDVFGNSIYMALKASLVTLEYAMLQLPQRVVKIRKYGGDNFSNQS